MMKRYKIFAVLMLLILSVLLALWLNRETIAVRYHLALMDSSWRRIAEVGPSDPKQSTWIERYDDHRDALVRHGYFERREFVLTHISYPSIQSKRLWQELLAKFPDHPHVTMHGYWPGTTDMIVVWDRPARMKRWRDIIQAHDLPQESVLPASVLLPRDEFVSFIGTWINDNDDLIYEILGDDSGNLRIEPWQGEEWKVVIKNVRAESGAILLDQYHYIRPSDSLKVPAWPFGLRPFSGVRCIVELVPVDGDRNKLRYTMSTRDLSEPIATILKREESIQDVP